MTCLLLRFWHLLNEDPGHFGPACVSVSILMALVAVSNAESHSHLSLVNVIAVTFNVAVTMKIVQGTFSCSHVECTLNRPRRTALGAIEGEIPAATALVTVVNPEVTSKVNMEGSVCVVLHEVTVL